MAGRACLIAALGAALWAAQPAVSAETGMDQVRALLGAGKSDEALGALRALVSAEPGNAAAHNALGSLLNSKGYFAAALPHSEKAVELAPANLRYRYNRGVVRAEHGRFVEAIADFDAALAADPEQVYAWLERGAAKLSLGDSAGASADWRKAAEVEPKLVWPRWYEATGDFVDGRFAAAAAGFDAVAAAEPGFVPANLWRAIAHGRAGTPIETPEPGSAEWPAAVLRLLRGELDEAALLTEAADDRISGDRRRIAEAHFFLAQRALIGGQHDVGREHLRRALKIPSPRHVWRIAAERELKQLERR